MQNFFLSMTMVGAVSAVASAPAVYAASSTQSTSTRASGADGLTRSIYVPIRFSIAESMARKLRVWVPEGETRLGLLPHTFMFTYFPGGVDKFLPEYVEVRLEAAEACAGKDYETSFLVTAHGIYSRESSIEFEVEGLKSQLRKGRRDLRVSPQLIRIRCPEASEGVDGADGTREVGESSDGQGPKSPEARADTDEERPKRETPSKRQ